MLYEAMHAALPPVLRAVWRPRIRGVDNVPREGAVILASNHLSFVDSVVIPSTAPRRVVFLAKKDYFTHPGVKGAVQRAWFEAMGMMPVDRDDTRAATGSLDAALQVLADGHAFGIYPEGTRSRDGRLYRGRTGVGELVLKSGAPVVPVGLRGTDRLQPVGSTMPRLVRIDVSFGTPLDFSGRFDGVPRGRARREITDEIMTGIATLSGQPMAEVYNERTPS